MIITTSIITKDEMTKDLCKDLNEKFGGAGITGNHIVNRMADGAFAVKITTNDITDDVKLESLTTSEYNNL